jgi:hypothetical protein
MCTHKFVQARMSCESFIPQHNVLWKLHSTPECLVKASFHTRMSCESFIPQHNVLWKLHSTPECLVKKRLKKKKKKILQEPFGPWYFPGICYPKTRALENAQL